jgi:hypothetical protein
MFLNDDSLQDLFIFEVQGIGPDRSGGEAGC